MITTSNNKKQHKFKTGVEELAEPLLKQLDSCPKDAIIGEVCRLVVEIKNIVESRQQWDIEKISLFGKIERYIDYWNENKADSELLENLKKLVEEQGVDLSTIVTIIGEEEENFFQKNTIFEVGEPSNSTDEVTENFSDKITSEAGEPSSSTDEVTENFSDKITCEVGEHFETNGQEKDDLIKILLEEEYAGDRGEQLLWRDFLYSSTVFPEDTKIKKRTLVLWWISLGLVVPRKGNTVEQLGDKYFSQLVSMGILKPVHTRSHNQVIDLCTMDPTFHRKLKYSYNKQGQEVVIDENINDKREGSWRFYCDEKCDVRALLNVDKKYLNSKDIKNVFGEKKAMKVVHLGRWRCIAEIGKEVDEKIDSKGNKSQDHIEVDDIDFLKKVGQNVTYISLRGISSIEALPESIGKLGDLRILDLRACHNLEKLPQKGRTLKFFQGKWFKNLSHLDISECYLLDHMPKWICELSNLQVLKGFVVGSGGKKDETCRLRDLTKLDKLRKLSIRICKLLDPEDASGLKWLSQLIVLTITWSINENANDSGKVRTMYFPSRLEKLDMRCYPEVEAAELNQRALPYLERLYIRGGKLRDIIRKGDGWKVKILRLKFLKHFQLDWNQLGGIFPLLKYVEYEQCLRLDNFPINRTAWNASIDGPFPAAPEETLKVNISYNYETTLAENKKKVMLQLIGRGNQQTAILDLVVVLDVSGSMKAVKNLEDMKTALLFVIKKLRSTDRLSIVIFSTEATKLWPLQEVDASSRKDLEHLVNSLKPDNTKPDDTINIFDGLRMGLDILKHCQNGSEHVTAIILVSNGKQSNGAGDAALIPIGDVAVHTFGLGNYHDPMVLKSIACRSMGGTFSYLKNPSQLTQAIGQCLALLLTVIAQDLTLTITPIEKSSTVELPSSAAEYYPQIKDIDAGSVTVQFGYLSAYEVQNVLVNLLLPAGEEGLADVLNVTYSYRLSSGITSKSIPRSVYVSRMKMVHSDQTAPPDEVIVEETRLKTLEMVKEAIALADDHKLHNALQNIVVAQKLIDKKLFNIWRQLYNMYSNVLSRPFAYSFLSSHYRQRVATIGTPEEFSQYYTEHSRALYSDAKEFHDQRYKSTKRSPVELCRKFYMKPA